MTDSGYFIAFEGGDGAGKSTQVGHLVAALEAAGREVVVTRQPGGTALGAALRDLVLHGEHITPRAEALVFARGFGFAIGVFAVLLLLAAAALLLVRAETRDQAIG